MARIMVVDDEKLVRWSISHGLRKDHHEVISACDGEQALRLIAEQPVDLVIMDYRMPRMDGVELLEKLKQLCPQVKVILLTAYGREFTRETAMAMGVWEYLEKPFIVDEIRDLVNHALMSNEMCA